MFSQSPADDGAESRRVKSQDKIYMIPINEIGSQNDLRERAQ